MRHSDDPIKNNWSTTSPSFTKYHGNGNDFLIFATNPLPPRGWFIKNAKKLCDRHRGVGADGIIVLTPTDSFVIMDVINADATVAQNCGNGLRCAASWWFKNHFVDHVVFNLSGRNFSCRKHEDSIHVDMGTCVLRLQEDFFFASQNLFSRVCEGHIGNVHRTFFLNRPADFRALLPEVKAKFLDVNSVNIGFVSQIEPGRFFSHVYERGVGWTNACGSGALIAASFLRYLNQTTTSEVVICQPGGELVISVTEESDLHYHVTQRGNAQEIFTGICQDLESW